MDRRVVFLLENVSKDPQHNWTVKCLTERVNLSKSRLEELFKTDTGMSVINCVQHIRYKKSCQPLETTFLSVKQISFEVGIVDQSHFVRGFKRRFGVTPSEYRKPNLSKDKLRESE